MNTAARQNNFFPLLRDIALFRGLASEQLRFLAANCSRRHAVRGQVLCDKGARLKGFFAVRKGRAKLAILAADGSERVVQIAVTGETLGESVGLLDQPLPFYAQALCDSELLFFDADGVRAAVLHWPALGMLFLEQACSRVHELYRDLETCCLHSAPQRVAGFLLDWLEYTCEQGGGSGMRVVLPAGKAVVASRLNLTPETFSRELRNLSSEGVIRVERGIVTIRSLEGLAAAAGRD